MVYVLNYLDPDETKSKITEYKSKISVAGIITKANLETNTSNGEYLDIDMVLYDSWIGKFENKTRHMQVLVNKIDRDRSHKKMFLRDIRKAVRRANICVLDGEIDGGFLLYDGKTYNSFCDDVQRKMVEYIKKNANNNRILSNSIYRNIWKFSIDKIVDDSWKKIVWSDVGVCRFCTKDSSYMDIKLGIYNDWRVWWLDRLLHIDNDKERNRIKKDVNLDRKMLDKFVNILIKDKIAIELDNTPYAKYNIYKYDFPRMYLENQKNLDKKGKWKIDYDKYKIINKVYKPNEFNVIKKVRTLDEFKNFVTTSVITQFERMNSKDVLKTNKNELEKTTKSIGLER